MVSNEWPEASEHVEADKRRLVKRTTMVARMFYHTGICLLCESNPLAGSNPAVQQEMHSWQMRNARELCGIVAHFKDRLVLSARSDEP